MLVRKFFFTVFVICFFYGCKEHPKMVEVIKINPYEAKDKINLSEFVDSVKYIKLQTPSDYPLGRIHSIIIKDNYIYAMDVSRHAYFVFDKNGQYISKLDKRGRGPGEYHFIGHIIIDDNEEFIEMITFFGRNKIIKYSNITFDFIEEYTLPDLDIIFNSVRKEGDIYYFAAQQMDNIVYGEKINADVLIVENGKIVKTLFDKTIKTGGSMFAPNIESFTKNDKGELFVSIMYDNTFYRLHDKNAYPVFTVDFGKYGIDNSIGIKSLQEQQDYLRTAYGLASFPVLNINNTDIMSFSYFFKESNNDFLPRLKDLHQYIKLKNHDKIYHTKKIKNDITGFPNEVFISIFNNMSHEAWHNDFLVDIVEPGRYFTGSETTKYVEGLGEIAEDDNPIIVLMRLKSDER